MPDLKISQLPAATTPLAGTELVPIVQSGTTDKVAVSDLTAGRAVSASALTASSGNLTFSGTAQRITGDMSNATVANRLMFQTSSAGSNSVIAAIPNGAATQASFVAAGNSDPTNASIIQMLANGTTDTRLISTYFGTGTYLPMTFYTGGNEAMRITTNRDVGIGTISPGAKLAISNPTASNSTVLIEALTTNRSYSTSNNGLSIVATASNGTLGTHDFGAITFNEAPNSNGASAYVNMYVGGQSSAYGNATRFLQASNPIGGGVDYLALWTNSNERMRIDASGNVVQNTAAVATNATAGFLWITSCAGAPTGAPTAPYTNAAALVCDTTNNRLYVLVGSTWRYATLT